MTRDIDIIIELKAENLDRFINSFKDEYYLDKDMIRKEIEHNGMFNIIHNKYIIKIDFIIHKKTEFQDATFKRRKRIKIENIAMWIISAEDIILAKLYWVKDSFFELQLKDIRNLLKTVEDLDLMYMEDWVKKMELQKIYERAKP